MENRVPYVPGEPLNPDRIDIGDLIIDKYPNPSYYGTIVEKGDTYYAIQWQFNTESYVNKFPYQMVTRLQDERIIKDAKQKLAVMLSAKGERDDYS